MMRASPGESLNPPWSTLAGSNPGISARGASCTVRRGTAAWLARWAEEVAGVSWRPLELSLMRRPGRVCSSSCAGRVVLGPRCGGVKSLRLGGWWALGVVCWDIFCLWFAQVTWMVMAKKGVWLWDLWGLEGVRGSTGGFFISWCGFCYASRRSDVD